MLKTKDILLSPLTSSDSLELFNWINDREGVLLNSFYKPVQEVQHKEWFENTTSRLDTFIFAIRLIEGGRLIGTCQLHTVDLINRSAELQIRIGVESERGKGYGTQAVTLLLIFAFNDINLQRVYLKVFATNERAFKSYLKAGFTKEGVLRKAAFVDGNYLDVMIMGILREEFNGG